MGGRDNCKSILLCQLLSAADHQINSQHAAVHRSVESIAVCLEPVEGNCSSSAGYFTLLCCCQWRDCAAPTLSLCPWPSARILCFKIILVIIAYSSHPWTQSKSWWDFSPFLQQHQHCWYIYIMNQINPKYSSSDWSWLDKASSRINSDTIFVKFNQTANTGTAMLYSGDPCGLSF